MKFYHIHCIIIFDRADLNCKSKEDPLSILPNPQHNEMSHRDSHY